MQKLKTYLYALVFLFNVGMICFLIFKRLKDLYVLFSFLTIQSFVLDTVYLGGIVYYEFKFKWNKPMLNDCSNYLFFTDVLYKYTFAATFVVCLCFWGLLLAGDTFLELKPSAAGIAVSIHTHAIINLVIMADIFFTSRSYVKNSSKDYLIVGIFYSVYCVWLTFLVKSMEKKLYPFVKNLNLVQVCLVYAIMFMVLVIGFNLYKIVLKARNRSVVREQSVAQEKLL